MTMNWFEVIEYLDGFWDGLDWGKDMDLGSPGDRGRSL